MQDRAGFVLSLVLAAVVTSCGTPGEGTAPGVVSYETRIVDSGDRIGRCMSLSFNPTGHPLISYADGRSGALDIAEFTGSDWRVSTVDGGAVLPGDDGGRCTSLAVDPSGSPHVAYIDRTDGSLKYAVWSGDRWRIKILDPGPDAVPGVSLALDSEGRAHIAFFHVLGDSRTPGAAVEAYPVYLTDDDDAGISPEPVDPSLVGVRVSDDAGAIHPSTSIVVGSDGSPRISYIDPVHHSLNLAVRRPEGGWSVTVIDGAPEEGVGYSHSMALDDAGRIHLSYVVTDLSQHGSSAAVLMYAVSDGTSWRKETVMDALQGLTGVGDSLTLGPDGSPVISFLDRSQGDLKIAYMRQGRWQIVPLDAGGLDGDETSIASSPLGVVGISYLQVPSGSASPRRAVKFSLVEY